MTGMMRTGAVWPALCKLAKHDRCVVGGILLLALALRFYDLTGESLWYDEAYSVWTSSMNILSPWLLWQWQVEFPLYYWLLHIWIRLNGAGEFSVRAFGAIAGAVSIWPMYYLGRDLGQALGAGRKVGIIGALLLAVNPFHIWYSQEVRMYAWAVLTTIGSLYAFWRIVRGARWPWWLAHVLLTGLTFHLHYYIGWMVLAQNLYYVGWLWLSGRGLFTRTGWPLFRRWLLHQVGVLVLALPAFFVFYTKAVGLNQWGWLAERYGPPGLAQVIDLVLVYVLGLAFPGPRAARWVVLLVTGAVLAFGLWQALRRARGASNREASETGAPDTESVWQSYALAAVTTVVPIAAVLLMGQWSAVWVPRYLLLFLPSFLLLLALSLGGGRNAAGGARRWRTSAAIVLLAASVYAIAGMFAEFQKEQWRDVTAYVRGRATDKDLLVLIDGDCRVPLGYYMSDVGRRIDVSRSANENKSELAQVITEVQRQQEGGHLWLLVSHANSDNLERALEALPSLTQVEKSDWVGIKLVNYVWE